MAQELKTKTSPSIQAQFKQFGAPFSAISRVIRDNSRAIQEQFETIGAISRQNTKNFPAAKN